VQVRFELSFHAHADAHLSILYKTRLPFILVFNKTDVSPHAFALEWMSDFEAFQAALASHSDTQDGDGEPTYMNSLMNSMSLVLDEFYKHLKVVAVKRRPSPMLMYSRRR
jgi:GTPase SAR1 family protein